MYSAIIIANCSRVAAPCGSSSASRPTATPEIRPSATAHVMGSFAKLETLPMSAKADRSPYTFMSQPLNAAYSYRIFATCSRVASPSGSNLPSPMPATILFSAAQITALVYHLLSATSRNGFSPVTAGSPSSV